MYEEMEESCEGRNSLRETKRQIGKLSSRIRGGRQRRQ